MTTLLILVMFTINGQLHWQARVAPSMEACQAALVEIGPKIPENARALCVELPGAPNT